MGIIASIASHVLYFFEKISLCCIAALLVSCTVITITFTLAFGIGLGYNYCFVDLKTKYKYVPSHYGYYGHPRRYGSRNAKMGNAVETDEKRLPYSESAISPDENNPANEMHQDNELDEPQESLDDISIPEDTTAAPITNSTINSSRDVTNVTEVTITSLHTKKNVEEFKTTKMVIPLSGLDLIGLLTRLRTENKNYTLQIVTD